MEAKELDTGEELLLSLPTVSFTTSVDEDLGAGHTFFCPFFCTDTFPL